MAPSEATTADILVELQYLRQRNKVLQSRVEKLTDQGDESVDAKSHEADDKEGPTSTIPLDGNTYNGLHHRHICKGSNAVTSPSPSPSRPPSPPSISRRHSSVEAKVGDVDTSKNDGLVDFPTAPKRKPEHDGFGPEEKAGFDNECDNTTLTDLTESKGIKRSIEGGGRHMKVLSLESGDDEESAQIPDLLMQNIPNGVGECDDLIHDDSSHKKRIPRAIPELSCSIASATINLPPFKDQLIERSGWLIGLLFLQSSSSFIIQYNERFLQEHMVIVQFLTMLVGAGGNAGNQASVGVIRSLAVGMFNRHTRRDFLIREAKMALSLSCLIGLTGFIRAVLFRTPQGETIAVTASVCAIVAISVAIGSTLPLGMKSVGIDPAHSSTTIQVIMDILGVLITVCVSSFVLSFKVFQKDGSKGVGGYDS